MAPVLAPCTLADVIRERGKGTFQIVVYLPRDPVTGRERRKRETFHGTRRAARDRERQLTLEARAGKHTQHDVTVKDLLEAWMAATSPDLAETTTYNYRRLIDQRIVPELGAIRLDKLTGARLDRYYAELRAEISPKTVRNIHAILRRALGQAQKWEWIVANPATLATAPKATKPDIRPPSREDVAGFLAGLMTTDAPLGTLCWLAAVTGARRGELAGLRWTDIDAATGGLLIERSVAQIGGTTVVKDTKTHQARRIALDGATVKLLELQRARVVDLADAAGVTFTTDLPVFPNEQTLEHLHPDTISKRYRAAADVTTPKMPGRLHDLRHFAATQALAAGVPVRTVSGRLGHANPATTLNVYSHFLEASDQVAADILGELVAGSSVDR